MRSLTSRGDQCTTAVLPPLCVVVDAHRVLNRSSKANVISST